MTRAFSWSLVLLLLAPALPALAQHSSLWGREGELWEPRGRLPDFSYAGYRAGREAIPDVPRVVNVRDFGARGSGDDTGSIQRAIDRAGEMGGGAVFIPEGRYEIRRPLVIRDSGVVLRGAGRNRTVLHVTRSLADVHGFDLAYANGSGGFITAERNGTRRRVGVVAEPARRGDRWITLNHDAAGLDIRRGRFLLLMMQADGLSLWNDRHNGQNGPPGSACDDAYGELGYWIVRVRSVVGRRVELDQPLRQDIELRWSPTIDLLRPLTGIGVEQLGIEFVRTPHPGHHLERGYNGIDFGSTRVVDSWIRDVRIRFADNGIDLSRAKNITVSNVRLDGTRPGDGFDGHHGVKAGIDTLFEDLRIDSNYIHEATLPERATGSVFSDGDGDVRWSLDHHSRAMIENLFTGQRTPYDWVSGGAACSPRAGARNTYWGFTHTMDPPNWSEMQTNVIGRLAAGVGERRTENRQWFEDLPAIEPTNLYRAQLRRRLDIEDTGRFSPGPAGVRAGWSERDPLRWAVTGQDGDRRYWLATTAYSAGEGGSLGEHSLLETPDLSDVTLSLRASTFELLRAEGGADYALVLGWRDGANHYFALVHADAGKSGIYAVVDGRRTQIAAVMDPLLTDGHWHDVRFERRGERLSLRFDGAEVAAVDDTTHGAGRVGVGSINDSVLFDDVVVDAPELLGWLGEEPAPVGVADPEEDLPVDGWELDPAEDPTEGDAPLADGGVPGPFDPVAPSSGGCSVGARPLGASSMWGLLVLAAAVPWRRRLSRARACRSGR